MAGRLILAAVPIGRPADATPRLAEVLAAADVIAAEDTRRLRRLLADLQVSTGARVVSYFAGNEDRRTAGLLEALRAGRTVVLLSDAGTPLLSDPGYPLVAAAVADGLPVTAVPGPSAITAALAVCGLPVQRFTFEGFPPRRRAARRTAYAALAGEPRTMVFFEAPHRLAASLADAAGAFGPDRPAAVCRELTKTHEEVRRGGLGELAAWAAAGVLGEITVVVAGAPAGAAGATGAAGAAGAAPDPAEVAARVAARQAGGLSRRSAVDAVAGELGLPRRTVYAAALPRRS